MDVRLIVIAHMYAWIRVRGLCTIVSFELWVLVGKGSVREIGCDRSFVDGPRRNL